MPINIKPIFENGFLTVKPCKHGYFAFNQFDSIVGKSLDNYGEWCDSELDFFGEILNPGDTILDIGAYIGTHTIFFAKKVGSLGKVFAFEPQRLSFQMLCTNLALNSICNTKCFQMGVSNKDGSMKLPVYDPYQELNFGAITIDRIAHGSDDLPIITIDSLKLDRCDHIKIDVEAMEAKVLEGAHSTIMKFRPTIYLENNKVSTSKAILQILKNQKYDCWWHFVPYFNPENFFKCEENIFDKELVEYNLICFPKEQNINLKGLVSVNDVNDDWTKALKRQYGALS